VSLGYVIFALLGVALIISLPCSYVASLNVVVLALVVVSGLRPSVVAVTLALSLGVVSLSALVVVSV